MQTVEEVIKDSADELSQSFCAMEDSCRLLKEASQEKEKLRRENEKLTEIFQFATLEFEKKNKRIALLEEELKELRRENEQLRKELEEKAARCNLLNKMVFGGKREKKEEKAVSPKAEGRKRGARRKHPGHGRKIPKNLPVREVIKDLPEDEKHCPCCGEPYVETGLEEVSSEITVEKVYYVKKIKRKVYKKSCSCPHPLVTAPPSQKLIPKGKFSIDFWVDVLLNKYKNHLPIERQIVEMREYGLPVPEGTIFGGFKKIHSSYLEPLYQAMVKSLREAYYIHADESGWRLFVQIDDKGNYKWFIWVFISKDVALFVLAPTRGAKVPGKILFNIEVEDAKLLEGPVVSAQNKKRMTVDKFSAYKTLERLGLVELTFCWTHQRGEFTDLKTKYPQLADWAEEWIKRIGNLYYINNKRMKHKPGEPLFERYDRKLRKKLRKIYALIHMEYNHPAQTAIMDSMKEHWRGLTIFVDCPDVDMDNNLSERIIRLLALGRKNYWGNHSIWAGELTVAMFSIVQTCSIHGISPRAYLTHYFTECAKRGSAPPEDEIEAFLPHKLSEATKKSLSISSPEQRAPP